MELSARNQLKGTITAIDLGAVMADITIDIGSEQTLSSAITRQSVERLGLKVGDQVVAIIKATEVMLGKPTRRPAGRQGDPSRGGTGMRRSGWRGIALIASLVVRRWWSRSAPSRRDAAAQASPAATPGAAAANATIELKGLVTNPGPMSIADLQQLPQETVDVTFESGSGTEKHTYTGVRLYDALDQLGLAIDPAGAQSAAAHVRRHHGQ